MKTGNLNDYNGISIQGIKVINSLEDLKKLINNHTYIYISSENHEVLSKGDIFNAIQTQGGEFDFDIICKNKEIYVENFGKVVQITVDENLEDFIAVEEDEENDEQNINKLKIKSVLLDSGVLIVNNGKISLLKAEEKSVLSYQNGEFKWIPYSDCENACE